MVLHSCGIAAGYGGIKPNHIWEPRTVSNLDPLLITVKEAAGVLSITPWSVYRLLDDQKIESRYQGRRRYVVVSSLHEYVETLSASPAAS